VTLDSDNAAEARRIPRPVLALAIALCAFVVLFVYVGRLIAPNDLYRKDQGKTMAYTVDVIVNHRFSLPRDPIFQPATKPPLYNWLAAAFCGPTGIYDEWAHKLPSLLGTIAVAAMLVVWCRRRFSDAFDASHALLLAVLAGTIWVASKSPISLMYIARPDMLQAMFLVAAWLAGHAALSKETKAEATRWAIAFWLAVTAAALTKGPAAVYPILYVLLAAPLCFGDWRRLRNLRWIPGLTLLFGSVGLWLACAARQDAEHVWNVLLGNEVKKRILESRIEGGVKSPQQSLIWFIAQNTVWSYLMLGSMLISLLGSVRRRFFSGTDIPVGVRAQPEEIEREYASDTDRNVCATESRFFHFLRIGPTEGFFTGAAGAANLWAVVVVACLSIPKDKRQDFLLPAHAAAAVLAAHFIVFCISRYRWARYALPLAGAVFLLDEKRAVGNAYVIGAVAATVAIVAVLAWMIRNRPRVLQYLFAIALGGFLAFEVMTNTRFGVSKLPATLSYVLLIFGAAKVAAIGIAAFRRARLEVPLIACGVLFWSYALLQNTYKDTNLPARKGVTGLAGLIARVYSPDPNSSGTGPGVYAARFAKQARKLVPDDEPLVFLVRSKSPILSLMGRHQGSQLTRADFEKAKWVIAERSKFPELNDPALAPGVPNPNRDAHEQLYSGILDVDYGSITGDGDIYKDRVALYRIENNKPSVDQLISIFRWVTNWTTRDANPYRSKGTGWVEGPGDPPIWTPPPGDPWAATKRRKGGYGD
jgi:4-amino-4-deoxy-L-arabinose transferase-like glycosyltransferase